MSTNKTHYQVQHKSVYTDDREWKIASRWNTFERAMEYAQRLRTFNDNLRVVKVTEVMMVDLSKRKE